MECAFGRLKSKFTIAHGSHKFGDKVMCPRLITILCALHNFLSREEGKEKRLTSTSWCTREEQAEIDAIDTDTLIRSWPAPQQQVLSTMCAAP